MTVNRHTPVSLINVPVKEGVIHLVSSILIPPHEHNHSDVLNIGRDDEAGREHSRDHHKLSVHELMERLEPYVE